jgi:hypothetical protein
MRTIISATSILLGVSLVFITTGAVSVIGLLAVVVGFISLITDKK